MTICPICHQKNQCNVDKQDNLCWCFTTKVDKELIALLPNNSINKSCICSRCISLFKEDKNAIITMLNPNKN